MVSLKPHKRPSAAMHGNARILYSSMCGMFFSVIFKSTVQRPTNHATPEKASNEPPLSHRSPIHARVDSIMGVRSSCSNSSNTGSVLNVNEKHHSLNNDDYKGSKIEGNPTSQNNHLNSLDRIALRKPLLARKPSNSQLYARSRLSERRRPRSSPLVNFGMSIDLTVLQVVLRTDSGARRTKA